MPGHKDQQGTRDGTALEWAGAQTPQPVEGVHARSFEALQVLERPGGDHQPRMREIRHQVVDEAFGYREPPCRDVQHPIGHCLRRSPVNRRMGWAGTPDTSHPAGTSLTTSELALTTLPSPSDTPRATVALAPTQT